MWLKYPDIWHFFRWTCRSFPSFLLVRKSPSNTCCHTASKHTKIVSESINTRSYTFTRFCQLLKQTSRRKIIETTGKWALKSITFANFDSRVCWQLTKTWFGEDTISYMFTKVTSVHATSLWNSVAHLRIYICLFLTNSSLKLLSSLFSSVDGFFLAVWLIYIKGLRGPG